MDLNSEEILDLLTPGNLQSKDVQIDFVNKKVYVTAVRENIGFLRQFMNTQGFEYVGETVKVQYNHNCCDCGSSSNFDAPDADPIQCFVVSSSEPSSINEDNCSPFVTLQKYAYLNPVSGCFSENLVLNLDTGCGCDSGNCTWRYEIPPSWFQVTDLSTNLVYNKLIGGFYQLSVENNEYILRELEEETYYPNISSPPVSASQILLNECPCLLETRNNSKFLKVNVLNVQYQDFKTVIAEWDYTGETFYTFAHLTGAINECAGNVNAINPNGTYIENQTLLNQWITELNINNVHVDTLEEDCFAPPASGMAVWLDGQDTIRGFNTIGDSIISWTDRSGNENNATSVGAPTLVEENGYKFASGFNSSNYFTCTSDGLSETTGFTMFCVAKAPSYFSGGNQVLSCQGPANLDAAMILTYAPDNYVNKSYFLESQTYSGNQTITQTINPTPLNTIGVLAGRLTANGATVDIIQSGDTLNSNPYVYAGAPAPFDSPIYIGAYSYDLAYFFNGEIAEVIIYFRPLTNDELYQTMNYLESKYSVT